MEGYLVLCRYLGTYLGTASQPGHRLISTPYLVDCPALSFQKHQKAPGARCQVPVTGLPVRQYLHLISLSPISVSEVVYHIIIIPIILIILLNHLPAVLSVTQLIIRHARLDTSIQSANSPYLPNHYHHHHHHYSSPTRITTRIHRPVLSFYYNYSQYRRYRRHRRCQRTKSSIASSY
ncbi:hypothetical protein F4778DRAFT_480409 [Xylariomycetidae sp. FL2044]|nr:hypothetical protein F4778DRAFT_480409 [Xylariomycetidae sp. FL2044]